ncbi:MAG TPA: adenosylcobinamide-GDP ribazoletransferase [Nitrospira sp.]|nr:adenosylcobinamide-GDP ribazoletransferase [Nitrospira sp.]
MTTSVRPLLFAWQFLTAVPLSRDHHQPAAGELAGSMMWYPLVGMLLGGLLAVTDLLLARWLSHEVVAGLLILLLVAVTRGLHQDGLADTVDGLAGGRTSAERLAIMRDPHIGALGATGLFLSLILKYSAIVSLSDVTRFPALLCVPAMGRWAMVAGAYGSPYARPEGGLGAPFLADLSVKHVIGSTVLIACLLTVTFGVVPAGVFLAAGAAIARMMTMFFRRVLGGVTGDTLGATNEVAEIIFLLSVPLTDLIP